MSRNSSVYQAISLAISNCELEPIHTPGYIQPHGAMLLLCLQDFKILQVSANVEIILGRTPEELLNSDFMSLFNIFSAKELKALIAMSNAGDPHYYRMPWKRIELDLILHHNDGWLIVEIEHVSTASQSTQIPFWNNWQTSFFRLESTENLKSLCQFSVDEVQRQIGCERVMIYRFDPEWNGDVISEAYKGEKESFLGLHFPASDIPAQARQLYTKKLIRVIPDVNYIPVPFFPAVLSQTEKTVDLSYASLRSVSPLHVEYLKNMGVSATITVSIIHNQRLWGLIACHHSEPMLISYGQSNLLEHFSKIFAYQLLKFEQKEEESYQRRQYEVQTSLYSTIVQQSSVLDAFHKNKEYFLNLINASGIALYLDQEWSQYGTVPEPAFLNQLKDWLLDQPAFHTGGNVFETNHLSQHFPEAATYHTVASGLLALLILPDSEGILLWFRPEVSQTINWSGDPRKGLSKDGSQLSPRKSFALYKEMVKGRATSWKNHETRIAQSLRDFFVEILLNLAEKQKIIANELEKMVDAKTKELQQANKKLIQSEEKQRLITEKIKDYSILMLDSEGRIQTWNTGAERIKGYTEEEVKGRHFSIFYPQEMIDSRFPEYILKQALLNGSFEAEGWRVRKDGSFFWADVLITAIYGENNEFIGFSKIARDMTEQKNAETQMEQAKLLAERSTLLKSEFLANMSHEIRTPINGVLGLTDVLLDTELNEDQRQYLAMMKSSGLSLLAVINDILDFSKIEAGKLLIEEISFNLRESLDSTFLSFMHQAKQKGLSIQYEVKPDVPEILIGDINRIRQILFNLVGNALKFTDAGEVFIGVEITQQEGRDVTLHMWVKDSGIGLSTEQQERIFEPFSQADNSTTRKYGGTGLGLSIVVKLLQLMGGELSLESTLGEGSCFHFTLPLKTDRSGLHIINVQEEAPQGLQSVKPLNILLAEDNKINQRVAQAILNKMGYIVSIAENGKQVLEMIEAKHYDLILMDILMPEMDGLDTTSTIRAQEQYSGNHLPIIALTANAMQEDKERCLKAGMDSFISKPFKKEELFSVIQSVLRLI